MPPKTKKKKKKKVSDAVKKGSNSRPNSPESVKKKGKAGRSKSPDKKQSASKKKSPKSSKAKKARSKSPKKTPAQKPKKKATKTKTKAKKKTKEVVKDQGHDSNLPPSFSVGSRVLALYASDGQYYEGTVLGVTGQNTPEVQHYVLFDGYSSPEPVAELKLIANATDLDPRQLVSAPAGTTTNEDQMQETNQYTAATNIQRIQRGIFGRSRANRVKQEYLRSMPIPIVSPGERLGNFGLQEMAAAGINAIKSKDYKKIKEYLYQCSRAENGADAAIIATGETPLHIVMQTGNMKVFKMFLRCKTMRIKFEKENRVGISATHEMILHNRIRFIHLLLKASYNNIEWDQKIGKQTCHGIDELTGQRCKNEAKEEGYCHSVQSHVREMISLQRERKRKSVEGSPPRTEEELSTMEMEEKINGLRADSTTSCKLSEMLGHIEISELLEGFREGSIIQMRAAIDQIQDVCKFAEKEKGIAIQMVRRKVVQALGALEGVLLRGTWRNRAPPDIEENLRHWRQCFLLDKRFRVTKSRRPVGVSGLEIELAGQLSDFIDNVRLCLPKECWNQQLQYCWLRILNIATDVYNIRAEEEEEENNRGSDLTMDKNSAFYTPPIKSDGKVEFYSDAHCSYTVPHS